MPPSTLRANAPVHLLAGRKRALRAAWSALLVASWTAVLGCAAAEDEVGTGVESGSGQGGSGISGSGGWATGGQLGAAGAAGSGASAGTGAAGAGGNVGGTGGGSGALSCSSDLHSVVDSTGAVVESCAAGQGCFNGSCVSACSAAESNAANLGCSFLIPSSPFTGAGWPGTDGLSMRGPCHALLVANAWSQPAKLSLQFGQQTLDVTQFARIPTGSAPYPKYQPLPATGLPPGEVAVVFLSHDPQANNGGIGLTCPVTPALTVDTALSSTGRGKAFRLTSDTPLTTYDIIPYGGARTFLPSASLLLPVSSFGDGYYAVAPHGNAKNPILRGMQWLTLVGSVDGTSVTITPKTTLPPGPGVSAAYAGKTSTFSLNAGETLQWLGADPTGALISSTHPIGAFAGNTQLWVTAGESTDGGQDAAHQQLPPISALGREYVGAGVVTRLANLQPETTVYRLLGVADGTVLTWEPAPPSGAPTTLGAGQVVELSTKEKFVVRSQDDAHAFSLTQYMTGSVFSAVMRKDGTSPMPIGVSPQCGIGDEEWVMVLAPGQFLSRYIFFTDPTYATTNLVITRKKSGGVFSDVTVDCLGVVSGWQNVGSSGDYQVAHVDLVRGMKPVAQCSGSRHEAWSDAAFGVTVWGTDWCASYAYPAGGAARPINGLTAAK